MEGRVKAIDDGAPERVTTGESETYDRLIGQTISGNFRLIKRLGSGAMGRVFKAEQLSLGKMVAVKVMRRELMTDPKLIMRFELEARAASALDHPNVIQIIDCGRDRDFLYIAMELLSGIDLGQLLKRECPIVLPRAARIIHQVLSALEDAHGRGIVHRDLKPGNIMLVERRGDPDFVKVCDFGIAKASSGERPDVTMAGLVFGTPEYMSPEQARGGAVDGRSDLYAVATMLYQLVAGEIPFLSPSAADIMARQLCELPTPPSGRAGAHIPPALDDLIMRGLAKNPAGRPQTATEFQDQLRQALAGIVDQWPGDGRSSPRAPIVQLQLEVPPRAATPAVASASSLASIVALSSAPALPPAVLPAAAARRSKRSLIAIFAGALVVAGVTYVLGGRGAAGDPAQRPAPSSATARRAVRAAAIGRAAPYDNVPGDDETTEDDEEAAAATAGRLPGVGSAEASGPRSTRSIGGLAKRPGARSHPSDKSARRPVADEPARRAAIETDNQAAAPEENAPSRLATSPEPRGDSPLQASTGAAGSK
jgi:serine/threonine protein kinase